MHRDRPLIRRLGMPGEPAMGLSEPQQAALRAFREKCRAGLYPREEALCLCGARPESGRLIARQDRYGLPVDTHLCLDCAVLWTSPRLTASALDRFYREDYRALYSGSQEASETFFARQLRHGEKIREFVGQVSAAGSPAPTVFDVGCGAGGTLQSFAGNGWRAFGCDLNAEYLERGRREGLSLIAGRAEDLASYGPADLIIASHLLEHLPDPLAELRGWAALLRADGRLYLELPGVLRAYERYGDIALFLQNAHLYHFTLHTLTALVARAGFRRVRGDEGIRALFVRDDDRFYPTGDRREADRVLRYLRSNEKRLARRRLIHGYRTFQSRIVRGLVGDRFVEAIKRRFS